MLGSRGVRVNPEEADPLAQDSRRLRETVAELVRQVEESRRTEQRLFLRDGVTRALADSSSLVEAAPRILRAVCESLGWQMGALWTVQPHTDVLLCVEIWQAGQAIAEFEAATRQRTFSRGVGMPGRVWASAEPKWIPDVARDENFPRAAIAAKVGLGASLGFPIAVGAEVVGVMEFFSQEILQPDQELLEMLSALGSQIGQFVERKRVEVELERFFTLSIDMLCIAGYDGYFKRLNSAWERTLGYSVEELTSSPFIEFVHPDDRAATLGQLEKLATGQATISFENRYRARDGSYKWMLWNATPFPQHQVIYAAARDITERKRAEDNIQRLRAEAEAANRAKSEFLARMSHEIRTPLNVVIGMGDVLQRTMLSTEQRQYIRVLQRAGTDLLTLINDVLDLSKVESGRITLEEIDFELNEVIEAVVEMMSMRATEKGIELRREIMADVPLRLRGDPDRLRQVLVNLVGNAIKFTAKGHVLLRVQSDPESPQVGHLRFSVSDTGIGIPTDKLDLIFESFTQADASTTRKYGGTGLGLAISKRLVELMEGRIWAESRPGTGAIFNFTARFGLASPETRGRPEGQTAPTLAIPAGPVGGLRILVADDSEDNRFLVAQYLKDLGCHLEFAEDGQVAIEKFGSGNFDLVLMDLQMPVLDGYEAARCIRQWEEEQKRPLTPIIALTASALESELQKAIDAGCTACLRKPIRLITLLEAIGKYAAVLSAGSTATERILVRADARLRAVIPRYLENRRGDVAAILRALERREYEPIRDLGHKMSGTGSAYGFSRITEIGTALEGAAKEGNPDEIRARVTELSKYLEQVEIV
jgi:PAS domain S-box-containing protein